MIRKKRTRSGKLRYSPRVHVGGGRYQMLGIFDTEREAKTAEAKWTLKQGGGSNQRGGQFADFYLEGYAARVKASTFGTAQTAINRWREQFETRRLSTIDATETEQWARENGWAAPAVVTMLNDAVRKGLIDRNPFKGLSKKGPGRRYLDPLTVDQVEELATIAEQHHGSPVKRIAFRRVVPRSSATSARPRRFLPSAVIPSKMVSQRLDRLCRVRRQQSFSSRPLCARSERQVEERSFPCEAPLLVQSGGRRFGPLK